MITRSRMKEMITRSRMEEMITRTRMEEMTDEELSLFIEAGKIYYNSRKKQEEYCQSYDANKHWVLHGSY